MRSVADQGGGTPPPLHTKWSGSWIGHGGGTAPSPNATKSCTNLPHFAKPRHGWHGMAWHGIIWEGVPVSYHLCHILDPVYPPKKSYLRHKNAMTKSCISCVALGRGNRPRI